MAANSKIEWTHHTFNPWWGCVRVSEGCTHCYAETFSKRVGQTVWGPLAPRRFFGDKKWAEPLKWNKDAEAAGERRRVFCASMADVFEILHRKHTQHAEMDAARDRLWALIDATPMLDWLLLTKRPENVNQLMPARWSEFPANVWIGATMEDQEATEKRMPHLLAVPARVRFLSVEPMIGPVDLAHRAGWLRGMDGSEGGGIQWVICGGESGHGARPMHPDWARSLRDQCNAANVPFHFKQWGEYGPPYFKSAYDVAETRVNASDYSWGGGAFSPKLGKHAAGRVLDGRTWDEYPQPVPISKVVAGT